MDEHRLGLKSIFRRVWTPVGVQATAEVNWQNQQVVLPLWVCASPIRSKVTSGSYP